MRLQDLPEEVLILIITHLDKEARCNIRCSSKLLRDIVDSPCIWAKKQIVLKNISQYRSHTWALLRERQIHNWVLEPESVAISDPMEVIADHGPAPPNSGSAYNPDVVNYAMFLSRYVRNFSDYVNVSQLLRLDNVTFVVTIEGMMMRISDRTVYDIYQSYPLDKAGKFEWVFEDNALAPTKLKVRLPISRGSIRHIIGLL